jgi:hypothetical protein
MKIYVLGIRHHGPGSSKNLRQALSALQPDCILVEGPADANDLIPYVGDPGLKPPVAMLLYNPKDLQQAAYLPFASFSPEWQTIQWGLRQGIPVRLMDLPIGWTFQDAQNQAELSLFRQPETGEHADALRLRRDPLGYMAQLAGYEDSERWWEVHFEERENSLEVFDVILEMMQVLREETAAVESEETLRREAYMRETIRTVIKEGFKKIVVVCGAWHAPVLQDILQRPAKTDKALLKGLNKVKVQGTWVPWTYERISFSSGYRAGVVSPAWYELLFGRRKDVVPRWMTKAARLLRQEDLQASSAQVIDAVRLSEELARLRHLAIPGLEELKEAAGSVFCDGDTTLLQLVEQKLVIGDVIGSVPRDIPQLPLQKDLEKRIKSARLSDALKTTETVRKDLNLRVGSNLKASQLLHQLNILNIPWGHTRQLSENLEGGFRENWSLKWKPDFALRIIEAGMLANTVPEAAAVKILQAAEEAHSLSDLTTFVQESLRADLKAVFNRLIRQLEVKSAQTRDLEQLIKALPPMIAIWRYGDTRQTDVKAVEQLIWHTIPRIAIGLPGLLSSIKDEVAERLFKELMELHQSIALLKEEQLETYWTDALLRVTDVPQVHPLLQGAATRLVFDQSLLELEEVGRRFHLGLSSPADLQGAAWWLEGFLHGSGLLLIYNPQLWRILDDWVATLSMELFQEILPLLRRTFARFSHAERRKMMALAQGVTPDKVRRGALQTIWDEERAAIIEPILDELLGEGEEV